jgi:hypothetical protein
MGTQFAEISKTFQKFIEKKETAPQAGVLKFFHNNRPIRCVFLIKLHYLQMFTLTYSVTGMVTVAKLGLVDGKAIHAEWVVPTFEISVHDTCILILKRHSR